MARQSPVRAATAAAAIRAAIRSGRPARRLEMNFRLFDT